MTPKEEAQVEDGLGQGALCAEQERDEQTPDPAVAVEKRVDRLELSVAQRGLDEQWRAVRDVVEELLE